MKECLLGIDLGTSSCKAALYQADGLLLGTATKEYPLYRPQSGWAEQNPDEWWQAVCAAIQNLMDHTHLSPACIRGIGVDGQSWSAIAVDSAGKVLHNTPIWMDTRAQDICTEVEQRIGEDAIFEVAGNPFSPSYTTPKILWYQQHLPHIYEQTHSILQSNSFIVYRLTGERSMDRSQGYGLHFFNMRTLDWDSDMRAQLGIDADMIPPLFYSHEVVGEVTEEAARQTGLQAGIPVVAGGLDAACGTLGAGVLHAGQTQEQGGQAGGMSICMDEYHADKRLILSPHVVPDKWLLQGGTVGGGGILNWFEQEFGAAERQQAKERGLSSFEVLSEEAATIAAGSDGIVFLPYMSGERSPLWNDRAKGVYYGLDYTKTRAHMVRASMEGVGFSVLHNLQVAKEAGVVADTLYAMGGSANSDVWTQLKSDITGKEIVVGTTDEATSIGTILLAGVGTGIYNSFDEGVEVFVQERKRFTPNKQNQTVYEERYHTYRALYDNLEQLMNETGGKE